MVSKYPYSSWCVQILMQFAACMDHGTQEALDALLVARLPGGWFYTSLEDEEYPDNDIFACYHTAGQTALGHHLPLPVLFEEMQGVGIPLDQPVDGNCQKSLIALWLLDHQECSDQSFQNCWHLPLLTFVRNPSIEGRLKTSAAFANYKCKRFELYPEVFVKHNDDPFALVR
ncbi:hypothetical protein PoB_003689500 [Plakobranchus ocellatus]|uniref:Uncharacterized protein n=1 Tax=Plakobranchus ocellatus TaxID=259542 RepID=A0AAV4AQ50_9GAST|nr:hypothetical protein PoB_003689500 [Plakobranchus ocellatus]